MFYINKLGKTVGAGVAGLFAAEVIDVICQASKIKSSSQDEAPSKEETDEELINPFRKLAIAGDWDVFVLAILKAVPDYPSEEIRIVWNELRKKK